MTPIHTTLLITGMVQGVGFRQEAKRRAQALHLTGYVVNQADKSVLIEIEGLEHDSQTFIEWCKTGTMLSQVRHVEIIEGAVKEYKEFIIVKDKSDLLSI